jgi:hypothetical protein
MPIHPPIRSVRPGALCSSAVDMHAITFVQGRDHAHPVYLERGHRKCNDHSTFDTISIAI